MAPCGDAEAAGSCPPAYAVSRSQRRRRKPYRLAWMAACGGLLLPGLMLYNAWSAERSASAPGARHLLQNENVTVPLLTLSPTTGESSLYPPDVFTMDELENGAVVLHILGIFYMFAGLAIVCDDYFVPALECITERLELSDDVAGATFMAAGGSAPELFTSIIGVFIARTNVGFGTIVGSAVFNVLFVIGACAVATIHIANDLALQEAQGGELQPWYRRGLHLTSWPLLRDSCFYGIDLIVLLIIFLDEKVWWWEALIMLCLYGLYVTFMKFNDTFHKIYRNVFGIPDDTAEVKVRPGSSQDSNQITTVVEPKPEAQAEAQKEEEEEGDGPWNPSAAWTDSESALDKFKYVLFFPLNLVLWKTVPNCTDDDQKPYYVVAFSMSIVWIAVFSYFMVWWADTFGKVVGIPPEVMGLTLLAAGTSVPDLISSIVVARAGHGDMAVSSSIGSNIFDICFGLPLPWFLYGLTVKGGRDPIDVTSNSLGSSVLMLVGMLIATIGLIILFGWRLNILLGASSVLLYLVFVTFTLLIEYEVIDGI